jgi:hypothetical protein
MFVVVDVASLDLIGPPAQECTGTIRRAEDDNVMGRAGKHPQWFVLLDEAVSQ